MNCNQARDTFFEIAPSGANAAADSAHPEVSSHLANCAECAKLLQALQQTMSVMDEWKSPEPSPYFNTRLNARLAELKREEATAPVGMLAWMHKPVFGLPIWRPVVAGIVTFALAVAVGLHNRPADITITPHTGNAVGASTAVSDLQKLEKNQDLYSDFDLLDDLKTDSSHSGAGNKGSSAEL
jgi:hypothetical protein